MIIAKELTRKFGDFTAVDRLNLEIKPSEIYGFLGPNGAGKTTTIRMLTGSLSITSGTVKILDMDIAEKPIEIKKRIGVVPEEPKMYGNLKGKEFVDFIINIYKVNRQETLGRLKELCDIFDINYLEDFINDYSHGMKQKLMVATVLMRKPDVIFLDEPTVGLDAKSAKILKMLIQKYAEEGTTIFFTTHILEIAEKMCKRIGIINKGKLIAEGTLNELRTKSRYKTLEDIFLELTGGEEVSDLIKEL